MAIFQFSVHKWSVMNNMVQVEVPERAGYISQALIALSNLKAMYRSARIFVQASISVAVHLGVMMDDTLSFTAKVDVVDF